MASIERVFDRYSGRPFRYGDDCCQFAGDCVEAMTGANPMRNFSYANKTQALKIISQWGSLEAAVRSVLGDPMSNRRPKTGDVCLIEAAPGRKAVAVVHHGSIVARVAGGLRRVPLSRALLVWST